MPTTAGALVVIRMGTKLEIVLGASMLKNDCSSLLFKHQGSWKHLVQKGISEFLSLNLHMVCSLIIILGTLGL